MDEKINYSELKKSIIDGCIVYLDTRNKGEHLPGLCHGKQGLTRALKAQAHASIIADQSTHHHSLLLALLLAIFNSSSSGLAMCIAAQLIAGRRQIVGFYDNDYLEKPVITLNTLKSTVFSDKMVSASAAVVENLEHIDDSRYGPVMEVNKPRCVRWILNHQTPNSRLFQQRMNQFKEDLDNEASAEIDSSISLS